MTNEFIGFPKIARYRREVIVTEKIDGTNACVYVDKDGGFWTGSRTRWITPEDDNYGFSRWANDHKTELMSLGPGRHFGEWWGSGCQRGYGLVGGEKRFSLFNVSRWCLNGQIPQQNQVILPACVGLVPVLWRGTFDDLSITDILLDLQRNGSRAAPGFMKPEGVVIYHVAANVGFKVTLEKDDEPKSKHRAHFSND